MVKPLQTNKSVVLFMEKNTTNSSKIQPLSSNGRTTDDSPEMSGWTTYFEDFFTNCSSDDFGSSSLVSDAASSAAWKLSDDQHHVVGSVLGLEKSSKKLSFKKRRTIGVGISHDDALEDTASSPVNSPKIGAFRHSDMNPIKRDNNTDSSHQDKESTSDQQTDEGDELDFVGGENEFTELKKRGLCLVPLSMLVKYLG